MTERTCSVVETGVICGKPVSGRGMCSKHYQRWQSNGDPLISRRPRQNPTCSECGKPSHNKGLCLKHYREQQMASRSPCSVKGCDEPWKSNGLCGKHYSRQRRHGTTDAPPPAGRPCSVDGCEGRTRAREYCQKHYANFRKHGTPIAPERKQVNKPCSENGCGELAARRNGMCDRHYREAVEAAKPACSEDSCERPVHSLGLCSLHYDRQRRYGSTSLPERPKWQRPKCSIKGCPNFARCRGWCDTHYSRWRAHGDPNIVLVHKRRARRDPAELGVDAKVCAKCKRLMPLTEFFRRSTTPDGRMYRCKDCVNDAYNERYENDPDFRERRRRHNRTQGEKRVVKADARLAKYGLTGADYDALLQGQGGVCAICKRPPGNGREDSRKKRLAVDHDHETRKVRGLLCDTCNVGLGVFRDSPELLIAAIRYLERSGTAKPSMANVLPIAPRLTKRVSGGETLW